MHAIVRHSVCASVKPPCTFAEILWLLGNHNANPSWPSVEHDALNDFLAPRTRS